MNELKKLESLSTFLYKKNLVTEAALVGHLYNDFHKEADNISMRIKSASNISTLDGFEAPEGFARETSHSKGWISPRGEYYYDPQRPDHCDWALEFAKGDPELTPKLEAAIRPIVDPPGLSDDEAVEFLELKQRESDYRNNVVGEKPWTWKAMGRIAELRLKLRGKQSDPYKDTYKVYMMKDAAKDVLLDAGWGKVSNAYTLEIRPPAPFVIEKWMELAENAPGHNPEATHRIFGKERTLLFEGSYWDINPRKIRS